MATLRERDRSRPLAHGAGNGIRREARGHVALARSRTQRLTEPVPDLDFFRQHGFLLVKNEQFETYAYADSIYRFEAGATTTAMVTVVGFDVVNFIRGKSDDVPASF